MRGSGRRPLDQQLPVALGQTDRQGDQARRPRRHDPIATKDGHHAEARALYADIRSMLAWAHEREYVKIKVPYCAKDPGYEQTARDIVYDADEIKLFWKAAD
jgi:hypothetical protein